MMKGACTIEADELVIEVREGDLIVVYKLFSGKLNIDPAQSFEGNMGGG